MDPKDRKKLLAVREYLNTKKRKVSITPTSSAFAPPPPLAAVTPVEGQTSHPLVSATINDPVVLSSGEKTTPVQEKIVEDVPDKAVEGALVYSSNLDVTSILHSPAAEEMSDSRSAAETVAGEEQPLDRDTAVPTTSEIRQAGDLLLSLSEEVPISTVPTAAEARLAEDLLNTLESNLVSTTAEARTTNDPLIALSERIPTNTASTDLNVPIPGTEMDVPTSTVAEPTKIICSEGLDLSIGMGRNTSGGEGTSQQGTGATIAELLAVNSELLARIKSLEETLFSLSSNVVGQANVAHNLANFRLGQQHLYDMLVRRGFITPDAVSADVIMNSILWSMYL